MGISRETASRYKKSRDVIALVELVKSRREEIENKVETEEIPKPIRKITINRNDIIMGLVDVAQDPGAPHAARVAAWSKLAEIYMLLPKNLRDLLNFYGWQSDEMAKFIEDGIIPERIRPFVANGFAALGAGSGSLRNDKTESGRG
jgi:hypothetical protein